MASSPGISARSASAKSPSSRQARLGSFSRQPSASRLSQAASARATSGSSTGVTISVRQASGSCATSSFSRRAGLKNRGKTRLMTASEAAHAAGTDAAHSQGMPINRPARAAMAAVSMSVAAMQPAPRGSGTSRGSRARGRPSRLSSAARPASSHSQRQQVSHGSTASMPSSRGASDGLLQCSRAADTACRAAASSEQRAARAMAAACVSTARREGASIRG